MKFTVASLINQTAGTGLICIFCSFCPPVHCCSEKVHFCKDRGTYKGGCSRKLAQFPLPCCRCNNTQQETSVVPAQRDFRGTQHTQEHETDTGTSVWIFSPACPARHMHTWGLSQCLSFQLFPSHRGIQIVSTCSIYQAIGTKDLESAQHKFGSVLPHDGITAALRLFYEVTSFQCQWKYDWGAVSWQHWSQIRDPSSQLFYMCV